MRARQWSFCAGLISAAITCAGAAPVPPGDGLLPATMPPGGVEISGPNVELTPAGNGMIPPGVPQARLQLDAPLTVTSLGANEFSALEREPQPDVAHWVEALRSPDFRVRDAATINLMQIDATREPELRYALRREKDDEASSRLLKAAIHLYMKLLTASDGDIGLLGITLLTEPMRMDSHSDLIGSIVVTEVQPGFPAEEFLKPGDRLLSLNGEAFAPDITLDYFKSKIKGAKPGRPLHLTLLRNGKVMKAEVPLAAAPDGEPLLQYIENRRGVIADFVRAVQPAQPPPMVIPDPDDDQPEPVRVESGLLIIPHNGGRILIGPGEMIIPNNNGGLMIVPQPVLPQQVPDESP